jgi:hypothetical protein
MPKLPFLAVLVPALLGLNFAAADPVPSTKLTVQVNSAISGKGVDRASVIIKFKRPADGNLKLLKKMSRTSWETKTNQQGSVGIPEIPMGEITIQIIADNFQTFGSVYQLNKPEQIISITLNPPQAQYSEDVKSSDVKTRK